MRCTVHVCSTGLSSTCDCVGPLFQFLTCSRYIFSTKANTLYLLIQRLLNIAVTHCLSNMSPAITCYTNINKFKFKFKFIGISVQYMPLVIYKKLLYGKDKQKNTTHNTIIKYMATYIVAIIMHRSRS